MSAAAGPSVPEADRTAPAPARAVVALGSNLGDRHAILEAALHELGDSAGVELVGASSFHDTVAVRPDGVDPNGPRFLNAVALVDTTLGAAELLTRLHEIERVHGRIRAERWGDRTLDLDLVAFGRLRSDSPSLTLPHPRAHERDFVLRPWLEVDPDAVLGDRGPVATLLDALDASEIVS